MFSLFHSIAIEKATWHATDIFGSNISVYLVKPNVITEISWSKALPAERRSLMFDEDDKAIKF